MEEKNKKRQIAKKVAFITSIFVIFISISYAFFTRTLEGIRKQVINAGVLDLVLDEDSEITISDAYPMYDEVGMIQEDVYKFRLINNTSNSTSYILKLNKVNTSNLDESLVKYGLIKNGETTIALLSTLEDGIIDEGTVVGNDTIEYELRLWIDNIVTDETLVSGKTLSYTLNVEVGQVKLDDYGCEVVRETKPNEPELTSGMIAVTYNESEKTWVKADTSNNDWYDYSNQIWANAVTVTEETRDTYMALDPGEPISMDDINTMWVWIPRYSYTIMGTYGRGGKCSDLGEITINSPATCRKVEYSQETKTQALAMCNNIVTSSGGPTVTTEQQCVNFIKSIEPTITTFENFIEFITSYGIITNPTGEVVETYPNNMAETTATAPGAIDIKFIGKNQKDTGTGSCTKCAENWVTPEGFTFGNEELPGFWMAKFNTAGEITENCTSESCTTADLTVKPNLESIRDGKISSYFYASRAMQNSSNAVKYGFEITGQGTMDVHMSKNTEWGIVAYLSQSKYGKYGNSNYKGIYKEVFVHWSSITGSSTGKPTVAIDGTEVTYDTPDTGYGASTTGNIYGVYDMSGGHETSVMANYNNITGSSGFCATDQTPSEDCVAWPEAKYYDLYKSTDRATAYKKGDALYETIDWNGDRAVYFFSPIEPWLRRGFNAPDTYAELGIFTYLSVPGEVVDFRLVIKP